MSALEEKRYFLDQDNSCHWYLVDASRREEWNAWRELDEDDERSWKAPDCAKSINGGASKVTFTNPTTP